MKKTSLLAIVPAVVLSALLVSGCGIFRSHKAWKTAQQEAPLEIPPNLDRPSTSAALVIPPPGANAPTADGVSAASGQVTDGFVLSDSVDSAYKRVGQALEGGNFGQVVSHDDSAHSYVLSVSGAAATQAKSGFFGRLFGREKNAADSAPGGAAHQVRIDIGSSGANGSEVRAQGNATAVGKVIDGLKSRLGS
ncbi:MAG: hypothetical protein ABIU96_02330 [Rhodanobacter sp.]